MFSSDLPYCMNSNILAEFTSSRLHVQKQPSGGVLRKMCSENMQQIYSRSPMPKSNFCMSHGIEVLKSFSEISFWFSIFENFTNSSEYFGMSFQILQKDFFAFTKTDDLVSQTLTSKACAFTTPIAAFFYGLVYIACFFLWQA